MSKRTSERKSLLNLAINISDLIRKIGKQFDQHERNLFRYHGVQGITPPQLFLLRVLWIEDEIPLKYLASIAKVSRATMSGIIDSMEKNGFIIRIPNPADGRSILIKLTKKGEDLKKYKPPIDLNMIEYFKDFKPEELELLNQLLEKLSNSIEI